MTASHMQLQQPGLVKPIGLSTTGTRQYISNSFSFDTSPPVIEAVAIAAAKKTLPRPKSTKRCLFGKPEPGSIKAIYDEESERQRQSAIKRFGFDVKTEKPVQNNSDDNNNNNTNSNSNKTNNLIPKIKTSVSSLLNELITSSSTSTSSSTIKNSILRDNSFNNINNNNNDNNNNIDNNNKECPIDSNFSNSNNIKITSELNCDEARGNINNNNNNNNINNNCKNTSTIKLNCNNNNNNECDFYSCNQTNNLLSKSENLMNKNQNNLSSIKTTTLLLSNSPMKSTKKSISERTQPYWKQSKITEFKFTAKKSLSTIKSTEKPKPQKAILHHLINNDGTTIEEKINIS